VARPRASSAWAVLSVAGPAWRAARIDPGGGAAGRV